MRRSVTSILLAVAPALFLAAEQGVRGGEWLRRQRAAEAEAAEATASAKPCGTASTWTLVGDLQLGWRRSLIPVQSTHILADRVSVAIDGEGAPWVLVKDFSKELAVLRHNGSDWIGLGEAFGEGQGFGPGDSYSGVRLAIGASGAPYVTADTGNYVGAWTFKEHATGSESASCADDGEWTDKNGVTCEKYEHYIRKGLVTVAAACAKDDGEASRRCLRTCWKCLPPGVSMGHWASLGPINAVSNETNETTNETRQKREDIEGLSAVVDAQGNFWAPSRGLLHRYSPSAGSWSVVGNATFHSDASGNRSLVESYMKRDYPAVALDSAGRPHVCFQRDGLILVSMFDGERWVDVGTMPVSDTAVRSTRDGFRSTRDSSIVVGRNGDTYIAFRDKDYKLRVLTHTAQGAWRIVGNLEAPAEGRWRNGWSSLAIGADDTLYVAYWDTTLKAAVVQAYGGSCAGDWRRAGVFTGARQHAPISLAADPATGAVVVGYVDGRHVPVIHKLDITV